jgi:hypothetical protein
MKDRQTTSGEIKTTQETDRGGTRDHTETSSGRSDIDSRQILLKIGSLAADSAPLVLETHLLLSVAGLSQLSEVRQEAPPGTSEALEPVILVRTSVAGPEQEKTMSMRDQAVTMSSEIEIET